jgi:hypothetical protein
VREDSTEGAMSPHVLSAGQGRIIMTHRSFGRLVVRLVLALAVMGAIAVIAPTGAMASEVLPPHVDIWSPYTGLTLTQGYTATINWTWGDGGSTGSFNVYAGKSDGSGFVKLNPSPIPVASGVTDYHYDWTVSKPAGTDWVVRVWYRNGSGQPTWSDQSGTFSIVSHYVDVDAPDADTWVRGTKETISWHVDSAIPDNSSFNIWIRPAFGTAWSKINPSPIPGGSSSNTYDYDWTVNKPADLYVVRVWLRNVDGRSVCEGDGDPFTVSPLTVTVTWPAVGTYFIIGSSNPIQWNTNAILDSGTFNVWVKNATTGLNWTKVNPSPLPVPSGTVNSGVGWTPPMSYPDDTHYVIRVWYRNANGTPIVSGDSPEFHVGFD